MLRLTLVALSVALASASNSTITVDYFFGSRWPGCRAFGGKDFVKVFDAFKGDDTVTFALNPAVRTPTGACIEEQNCNWEKATLCAFNGTAIADQVKFLACMDESKQTKALAAAKECGADVESCYNSAESQTLLEAASKVWNKNFPGRTFVPHVMVDGKQAQADYSDIKKALCAAGSQAAACKSPSDLSCAI